MSGSLLHTNQERHEDGIPKGPWKLPKARTRTMENRQPMLKKMGPQASCKVKVDHVEGPQHNFGFGFPPNVDIVFLEANDSDNLIHFHGP